MRCINLQDYEQQARTKLRPEHYDYFSGGAQDEVTLRENGAAFRRIKLRPRVLRGGLQGELGIDLLGAVLDMPVVIAPTAFHRLAHPQGECATARASQDAGTLMIISMASTTPVEEITAVASPRGRRQNFWFQLYIQSDRGFTAELISRVEAAGVSALVITADSPTFGRHERDLRHRFLDLPEGLHCEHMRIPGSDTYRSIEFDPTLSWGDIDWLRSVSRLPLVIKGITHPEDARLAINHGASGLMVSNHGGRQLDTVAATIDLLPDVVQAVQGEVPILLDGGIRLGTDVLKALALGATAVGLGRPILWGLAVSGQEGVAEVLNFLREDLLRALMLCGCQSLDTLDEDILFHTRDPLR